MTIELKFKAPVSLKAYPRVIMLANNIDSIVGKLIEGRNLTQQDREALEIRLMHIPVPKDAQQWLADKGGYLFTKDPEGKRGHWVDGTDPKKDFRIARHILWLYENREKNPPGRFLVQGNRHPDVLYKMQSESGNTGIVIDALVDMIESGLNRPTFRVVEGKAYYMISSVQDAVRELAIKRRERITGKQVTECMKGLTLPHDGREIVLPGAEELGPREWLIVDARLLLAVAKKEGKAYKILSTLEGAR